MEYTMDFFVVLTVPHAVAPCKKYTSHDSDTVALDAAYAIQKAVSAQQTIIIPAKVPRYIRDLNRPFARTSEWRKDVADHIQKGPHGKTVLLDVHSYPEKYIPFDGADVVMMVEDLSAIGAFRTLLLSSLMQSFRVGLIQRPETLDIASTAGVPATLLEFSEGNTIDVLGAMGEKIAEAIRMFFKNGGDNGLVIFPNEEYRETPTDMGRRLCKACSKKPSMFACGGCLAVAYCSSGCQKQDWVQHARTCCYPQKELTNKSNY
jgi:hypothetical protein